jgi:dihydroflavonol-4-reductase
MRVFLTGGTGFISQPLTAARVNHRWGVTALVRNHSGAAGKALARLGARPVPGDVTDRDSMRAPMTDADLVVHNAGVYELGGSAAVARRMVAVNVQGTEHLLARVQELGVPRIVYVSSVQAYGDSGRGLVSRINPLPST